MNNASLSYNTYSFQCPQKYHIETNASLALHTRKKIFGYHNPPVFLIIYTILKQINLDKNFIALRQLEVLFILFVLSISFFLWKPVHITYDIKEKLAKLVGKK